MTDPIATREAGYEFGWIPLPFACCEHCGIILTHPAEATGHADPCYFGCNDEAAE